MNNELPDYASLPFVSVVIPVYNDSERLERCLKTLQNQTYSQELYEVIVVDNGSDLEIDTIVSGYTQAVLSVETNPGSYAARNKGISVSKGKIIAFTDSDCIPVSDWIEKGVLKLESLPEYGFVAGKIKMFFKNPKKLSAVEIYENIRSFNQKKNIEKYQHGVTANLFTYKKVLEHAGCFSETLKSGGDVEWGKRVHALGYKIYFADEVCVFHPARHTFGELYKKTTRVVGGIYDWKGKRNPYSIKLLLFDLIKILRFVLSIAISFNRKSSFSRNLVGTRHKIQYIRVVVFVGLAKIFEKTRLQLGGNSRR